MIKVKLNNSKFNYDVYQIINLFYLFPEIKFVEEDYDYKIEITEDVVEVIYGTDNYVHRINKAHTIKEEVKKAIFLYFSKNTTTKLPWGTLIGII
jgi:hypothetical protein